MQIYWKKIGLPCLIHSHENDILPVKTGPHGFSACDARVICGDGRGLTDLRGDFNQ